MTVMKLRRALFNLVKRKIHNEKRIRFYRSKQRKYREQISMIKIREVNYRRRIRSQIIHINRWKKELIINMKKEGIISKQLKQIDFKCLHLILRIRKVKMLLHSAKNKYKYYYESFLKFTPKRKLKNQ